ncbi:hypothetical protein JOQ06_013125, partial [Pogonophryne albipinna]
MFEKKKRSSFMGESVYPAKVFVFSTFGKPRKKSITKEVLLAVTDKVRATTKKKDNDEGDEKATFWGEVCQELGIPDSKTNRTRLHHAYNHHKKMRHKTKMVTAAPASPSTDSDHTACPIDSDHSATDSDRTVPATPSSVTQAFTETIEPEDVSECNSSGTYDSSSHSKDGVRTVGSKRKGSLFSCVGYCRFDDCPVEVEVDIEDESSLKAVVTFRVLMESMAYNFCGVSLQELLSSAAKHYHLAMHVFGLMTQATTMSELDEVVTSAVVVFSSSHSDRNVGKHFENLQGLLTNSAQSNLDDATIVEDCVNYTEDNKTQGIMEKSQWDLKKISFQRRRLTRLDDFVHTYKVTLSALLREYGDSLRRGKKDPKDKARQGQSSSTSKMTVHAEDVRGEVKWMLHQ